MAVAVEVRVPLLDVDMVSFAAKCRQRSNSRARWEGGLQARDGTLSAP